VKDHRKMKCC